MVQVKRVPQMASIQTWRRTGGVLERWNDDGSGPDARGIADEHGESSPDAAIERKVVVKSGSYFSFGDERLGQGRQNATAFLKEHPDLVQSILQGIQAQMGPGQIVSARLLAQVEPSEATPVVEVEEETVAA